MAQFDISGCYELSEAVTLALLPFDHQTKTRLVALLALGMVLSYSEVFGISWWVGLGSRPEPLIHLSMSTTTDLDILIANS